MRDTASGTWVKGNTLRPEAQKQALARFVHRYTGDHRPAWVNAHKWKGDQEYPLQFKDDKDWLLNTWFCITKDGSIHDGVDHCESTPTWPQGKGDEDAGEHDSFKLAKSIRKGGEGLKAFTVILKFPDYLEDMAAEAVLQVSSEGIDSAIEEAQRDLMKTYDADNHDDFRVIAVFNGHHEALNLKK